jgi:hypothetical protein
VATDGRGGEVKDGDRHRDHRYAVGGLVEVMGDLADVEDGPDQGDCRDREQDAAQATEARRGQRNQAETRNNGEHDQRRGLQIHAQHPLALGFRFAGSLLGVRFALLVVRALGLGCFAQRRRRFGVRLDL